ncbi:MAG: glucosamine-6-phosphate isomerase [Clostridia bacterium]|nr:glucosamine-6-phosphate isomerase [Clostridia bacterium]
MNSPFELKIVKTEWDVYFDMALKMLDVIMKNNAAGKKTVMIVPVGPTDQYPILAKLVNRLRVSLKDVYFFNMDEYMWDAKTMIENTHPMSFKKRMETEFYALVDEDLVMPASQRLFPTAEDPAAYDRMIEDLGGVDLCLGGLGINGHLAFNEAEEEDSPVTADEFAALGTRVLPITRETRTINAYGYQRGDLRGMPEWCITIGMKQILEAKEIYIALNRPWQHGIFKHVLQDDVQPQIPATLLKTHKNVTFCLAKEIADGLF